MCVVAMTKKLEAYAYIGSGDGGDLEGTVKARSEEEREKGFKEVKKGVWSILGVSGGRYCSSVMISTRFRALLRLQHEYVLALGILMILSTGWILSH